MLWNRYCVTPPYRWGKVNQNLTQFVNVTRSVLIPKAIIFLLPHAAAWGVFRFGKMLKRAPGVTIHIHTMYGNKVKCGFYFSINQENFRIQVKDTLELHPWEDTRGVQGEKHCPGAATSLQLLLSELPPKRTLKPHTKLCLLTGEIQLISKSKTFAAKAWWPPTLFTSVGSNDF